MPIAEEGCCSIRTDEVSAFSVSRTSVGQVEMKATATTLASQAKGRYAVFEPWTGNRSLPRACCLTC